MSELLPCPFCGGSEISIGASGGEYYVECDTCDAYVVVEADINNYSPDYHMIVEQKWNTRTPATSAEPPVFPPDAEELS